MASMDIQSVQKIDNTGMECNPLAVSLKISSSTKLKQQRVISKEQGLNTQASRDQLPTDLFAKVIDNGQQQWKNDGDNQLKKNNFMLAEKTVEYDETSSVVQASTKDG